MSLHTVIESKQSSRTQRHMDQVLCEGDPIDQVNLNLVLRENGTAP